MEEPYLIRSAHREEWEEAMALAWRTFLKFEAGEFSPEGVRNFEQFVTDSTLHRMFVIGTYQLLLALDGARIVGMVAFRSDAHLSLLFVEAAYHRQGIGRALVAQAAASLRAERKAGRMTVNASPYATPFYHRLGFRDTGPQETKDGIVYTPMEFAL